MYWINLIIISYNKNIEKWQVSFLGSLDKINYSSGSSLITRQYLPNLEFDLFKIIQTNKNIGKW